MDMILRVINGGLIVLMAWMSSRAGWGMMTNSEAMVKFFEPWGTTPLLRQVLGLIAFVGCWMMFHPKTFVWGSWMNMGVVLFLLVQFAHHRDWKGLLGESWVIVLGFVILWLGHPLIERSA